MRHQVFHPSANSIARASLLALGGSLILLAWIGVFVDRSPYTTNVGVILTQPIPFSHKHHVELLGIDCRYCHQHVEDSSFAGIPPTETCMHCHSQIWADSPMLEPVRYSYETNTPIVWNRVHDLPDYVYFNHSIHIAKGVGCVTCHGRVDQMPLTWRAHTLHMEWCLDCHRAPEKYLRPRDQIYNFEWAPEGDQLELGERLVEEYGIIKNGLTDCWTCHR
ncbi:MAG: cytochrome c3 family protein [Phycisphaerales bacterium]